MGQVLELGKFHQHEVDEIAKHYDVIRITQGNNPEALIREEGNNIKAIVSTFNGGGVSRKLMEALPNLEIIAQFGAGFDNIDVSAAKERGIVVTNTPGVVTDETADTAIALIMNLSRRFVEYDMFVRVGHWGVKPLGLGRSLADKTVGIIGLGRIGRAIAKRAEAFGMRVIYNGPRKKDDVSYEYYADLEEMAKECHFLVAACVGGEDTQGIINAKVLNALGKKGYVINVARGSVVNEEDLLIALSNEAIAGAGLDVYWNEPKVPEALFSMDNVVLFPHIAGGTIESREKMLQLMLLNLKRYFDGEALVSPV